MIDDEDIEETEEKPDATGKKRKRIMILLLPLLIVIGISVGIYFALNNGYDSLGVDYKIIQYNKDNAEGITAFYDLPEIKTSVKDKRSAHELRLKVNLELSSIEDQKAIEALSPKLSDMIISHIIELTFEEVNGSTGLYWLKEELLYRLNLAAAPVKIKNINFSIFELQK